MAGEEGKYFKNSAMVAISGACDKVVDFFEQASVWFIDFFNAGLKFIPPFQIGIQFAGGEVLSGCLKFFAAGHVDMGGDILGRNLDALGEQLHRVRNFSQVIVGYRFFKFCPGCALAMSQVGGVVVENFIDGQGLRLTLDPDAIQETNVVF